MCIILLPLMLILWPIVGISGSVVGGVAYGFLSPLFATFEAIEGEDNKIFHCFIVCFVSLVHLTRKNRSSMLFCKKVCP